MATLHPMSTVHHLILPATRLLALALLLILAVAAPPVVGQAGGGIDDGSWIALNPPRAADLTARLLDIDCPYDFTCYAVGEEGTVVRTSGGDRWRRLAGPSTQVLDAIDCPTVAVCLVVAGRDVYYGFDFDSTRGRLPTGSTARLRDIDCPAVEDCVVVGDAGTILLTHDHGQTWTAASPVMSQDLRGISCPSTRTCFASGGEGLVLASTDGGATWRVVLDSPAAGGSGATRAFGRLSCPSENTCFVTASRTLGSTTSHAIVRTINGGATWSYTIVGEGHAGVGSIDCPEPDTCFATLPSASTPMISILSRSEIYWGPVFDGVRVPPLEAVSCPNDSICYAVGANGTLAYSFQSDSRKSWNFDPPPLGNLNAIVCPTPQDCYAAGDRGSLHHSHDGGATWRTQVVPGVADPPADTDAAMMTFTGVACTTPTVCFAVGGDLAADSTYRAIVYGTDDGGETWHLLHQSKANGLRAIDCPSARVCLTVGTGLDDRRMVLSTRDGGATWVRRDVGDPANSLDVDCPTEDTCYAAGGGVTVTRDGGATWQMLNLGRAGRLAVHPYAITCPSPERCLLLARGSDFQVRLFRTENGGAAWTERTPPAWVWVREAGGIHCFSELDCILVGDRTLSTQDGGQTWQVQARSGPSWSGMVSSVSCAAPDACMATTLEGLVLAWNHPPSVDFNGDLPGTDSTAPFAYASGGPPVPLFDMGAIADPDPWQRLESVVVAIVNPQNDPYYERLSIDPALLRGLGGRLDYQLGEHNRSLIVSGNASIADYEQVLSSLRYAYTAPNPDTVERVISITAYDAALASNAATTTVAIRGASAAEPVVAGFTATARADGRVELAWETRAEPDVSGYLLRRARWAGAWVVRLNEASPIPAAGSPTSGARYTADDRPGVGRFRYWLEASDARTLRQVVAAADVWVGVGRVYLPSVERSGR